MNERRAGERCPPHHRAGPRWGWRTPSDAASPVCGSKLGHLLGASGAISALAATLAIRDGIIPPSINLQHPDTECDLDYVPNVARRIPVQAAMVNAFGFGGQNVVVLLRRYEECDR